ncbi:helix-turn-helix transcriptional regulator [Streptomyces sp. NPDC003077]|uniref:helix-turn-helix domain-containing protein n=1 Tax=Streptomyces sp. NPDC003077 TaxID=3154443 RepID=UPI0033A2F322
MRDSIFRERIGMATYVPAALLVAAEGLGDRTPADMARRMGVPYLAAYRWATGRHAPNPSGLAAIERAYGLTAADLMREDSAA